METKSSYWSLVMHVPSHHLPDYFEGESYWSGSEG